MTWHERSRGWGCLRSCVGRATGPHCISARRDTAAEYQLFKSQLSSLHFHPALRVETRDLWVSQCVRILTHGHDAAGDDGLDVQRLRPTDKTIALGARVQPHLGDPLLCDFT